MAPEGFSLVELMIAVVLSGAVIFGIAQMLQDSVEDVAYYQKKEKTIDPYRKFSVEWSSLLKRAGMAHHFQKLPVNISSPKPCDAHAQGPCVFTIRSSPPQKSTGKKTPENPSETNKKSSPLICPLDRSLVKQITEHNPKLSGMQLYINLFKDEFLTTTSQPPSGIAEDLRPSSADCKRSSTEKKAPCIFTHQRATIPSDLRASKEVRHFVGWKITPGYPLPILVSEDRISPFTLHVPPKMMPDLTKEYRGKQVSTSGQPNQYLLRSSRPLNDKGKKNSELSRVQGQLVIFYDVADPRIYTLVRIDQILPCAKAENQNKCKSYIEETFGGPTSDTIKELHQSIIENPKTYLIDIKTIDGPNVDQDSLEYYFKENSKPSDETLKIAHNIKWFNKNKIFLFPLSGFSLDLRGFDNGKSIKKDPFFGNKPLSSIASNIYKVSYYLSNKSNNSKSALVGLPVQLATLHVTKKSKKHKLVDHFSLVMKRYKKKQTKEGDAFYSHKILIPSLIIDEREGNDRKGASYKKREDVIIGRQFGTRNISAFIMDTKRDACKKST